MHLVAQNLLQCETGENQSISMYKLFEQPFNKEKHQRANNITLAFTIIPVQAVCTDWMSGACKNPGFPCFNMLPYLSSGSYITLLIAVCYRFWGQLPSVLLTPRTRNTGNETRFLSSCTRAEKDICPRGILAINHAQIRQRSCFCWGFVRYWGYNPWYIRVLTLDCDLARCTCSSVFLASFPTVRSK